MAAQHRRAPVLGFSVSVSGAQADPASVRQERKSQTDLGRLLFLLAGIPSDWRGTALLRRFPEHAARGNTGVPTLAFNSWQRRAVDFRHIVLNVLRHS